MKDVIVIGGGASGLVAAIYAAQSGSNVTLLEKNPNCGKKILITGNGKCNYWNHDQNLSHYHSHNQELLPKILLPKNQEEILKFFHRIGIVPKIKDGYYYPYSGQATSIQTALIKEAMLSGVEILTNTEVITITKEQQLFKITTNTQIYQAKKVILATGSKACPKTGSNGFGYKIAEHFGHHIITPLPALVQLKMDTPFLKEWHGIRSDVSVTLIENNKKIDTKIGEIQLTNYGVSGICVFCLSGQVSKGLFQKKQEQILINFLHPFSIYNKEEFITWMEKRNHEIKNRTISDLLDGLLNYKLINLILKLSKIKKEATWSRITTKQKQLLGKNLTQFTTNIIGTNSFEQAQVCTGGVSLSEINPTTMESLKTPGLYLTGELLDVDGDCGGYNLTFAWITGYLAGHNIKGEKHDQNTTNKNISK